MFHNYKAKNIVYYHQYKLNYARHIDYHMICQGSPREDSHKFTFKKIIATGDEFRCFVGVYGHQKKGGRTYFTPWGVPRSSDKIMVKGILDLKKRWIITLVERL